MRMSRGIRTKCQLEFLGGGSQLVENNSRLHAGILFVMIQLENLIAVLGKIKNDGEVATLTTKTGATSAREHRSSMHAAESHCRNCVLDISRNNDSYRNLAIIRSVGRVQRTSSVTTSHLAFDYFSETMLQFPRLREGLVLSRVMRTWRKN